MPEVDFTLFDILVVVVVVVSALFAWLRGAVRETLTIAAWLGAIAVAWSSFGAVQTFAQDTIETPWLADAAALVLVLVVPLILFKILAVVIAEQLPRGWFGHLDQGLGLVFGLVRGAVIVSAALLGLGLVLAPERQPQWVRDGQLQPYVQEGAALLQRLLPRPAEAATGAAATPPTPAAGRAT